MASSIRNVVEQIDKVARASGFQCRPVSWEDAQRGHVGGMLSSIGANISDVRLWEKGGKLLYTLRSDNWNERLGFVRPEEVSVIVGNHQLGGSPPTPITLREYLESLGTFANYANVKADASLFDAKVDTLFTIRFQCVFLPIAGNDRLEFCTEVYNYNTHSDLHPRNLLLLATPQGTSVQQDGAGAKKLYFHAVDPTGGIHRYWLEAERSTHSVGGPQHETAEEAEDAAERGKATAIHIGTRAMGSRFNVQMLVQVPLVQPPPDRRPRLAASGASASKSKKKSCSASDLCAGCAPPPQDNSMETLTCRKRCRNDAEVSDRRVGESNAARVSRGSEVSERWFGVAKPGAKRDPAQHGTITVSMYYTVADGVPSEEDVRLAIADLNSLYASCEQECRLADSGVPTPLTGKAVTEIVQKVAFQPYSPPAFSATGSGSNLAGGAGTKAAANKAKDTAKNAAKTKKK